MSPRTPLGEARGLGSAKTGTEHWLMERVTSIASIPLVIGFVYFILAHVGRSRAGMLASLHNPFVAIFLALTLLSVIWHMKLGLQVVIEDYVHGAGAKLAMLLLNGAYAVALAAAGLYAILKMSFGL